MKGKLRGEDGCTVTSIRIKTETFRVLEKFAGMLNFSRNKVIELILDGAVEKMLEEMERRNDGQADR